MDIQPETFLNRRVLVAALNWGLGHATRCIPLIKTLERAGAKVTLASDGRALKLWRQEFPELLSLEMPAYGIRYPSSSMLWNMFWQGPKIQLAIMRERRWLSKHFQANPYDVIISDNRFGCYHPEVQNIFITHQLNIQTPWSIASWLANTFNHRLIGNFNECWVPDWAGEENLSGTLSHGKCIERANLPPIKYIGPLSRFSTDGSEREREKNTIPYEYEAIAILSGPEPQRTYLEKELLLQLNHLPGNYLLVQGVTEQQSRSRQGKVDVFSFMTSKQLEQAIVKSKVVICRSGYSSLMDLVALGKMAILIPTPGQTEQEYLGVYLSKRECFVLMEQGKVNVADAMNCLNTVGG